MMKTPVQYSVGEEIANASIHGLAVLLSIAGLTALLLLAGLFGTLTHALAYLIYGFSLILLYTASTLYHALPQPGAKRVFKVLDHAAIYLLIAGSYTPFMVLHLKGDLGFYVLIAEWLLAACGVLFKLFYTGRFRLLSTAIYLAMGWSVVVAIGPLQQAVSGEVLTWLFAGGILYSVGVPFYLLKKLRYHHAIWHLFVLSGSIAHYVAIFKASQLWLK